MAKTEPETVNAAEAKPETGAEASAGTGTQRKTKWYHPREHVRRMNMPGPSNEVITERLTSLVKPAALSQVRSFIDMGFRNRKLGLVVMVAVVLAMLWQQVPSVCELARMLNREALLWANALAVTQQGLDKRFLEFPAAAFRGVFLELLPRLEERWAARKRPLPESVVQAQKHFDDILVVDCSTMAAIFRKLKELWAVPQGMLGGKICTVINLASRLPRQVWYSENPSAHESWFEKDLMTLIGQKVLCIFDRGFYDVGFFDRLIDAGGHLITRLRSNTRYRITRCLQKSADIRDHLIVLGSESARCQHTMRLVEVRYRNTWYRYLTSVLDPDVLPAAVVADLYRRRWRIEEAFLIVKRVLHLSYLWTGSTNGILLQIWATWLFYAVLIDLADAVAEELMLPFDRISIEMTFRGLYHFHRAHARGEAHDPVAYLAAPENKDLGVVKRIDKRRSPSTAPSPAAASLA